MSKISQLDALIDRLCRWGLYLCLFFMLFLTLFNIVLRFFESSMLWIDPLVRHTVFLSAFLGGALATGRNKNIAIDILANYFKDHKDSKANKIINLIIYTVCLVTLIWLTKAGIDLVELEIEYGRKVFLSIHSSFLIGIIPFGLGIISLRFFFKISDELPIFQRG